MHSNDKLESLELKNQKDYRRQQERLKAMAGKTEKVVSINPNAMIDNFLKESSLKSLKNDQTEIQSELPIWLRCESVTNPPEYKYFWSLVQSNFYMADTQKVSQLLLRSNLSLDVLGHIWNLANKVVPGHLTKQEFYIVLALVSLAQSGMAFNNLNVLKLVPVPVIPILKIDVPKKLMSCKSEHFQQNPNYQPTTFQNLSLPQHSNNIPFQSAFSSHSQETEHKKFSSSEVVYKPSSAFSCDIYENNVSFAPCSKENLSTVGGNGSSSIKLTKQNTSNQFLNNNSNFFSTDSSSAEGLEDEFSDFQSVTTEQDYPQTNSTSGFEDSNDDFTDFQCVTIQNKENLNAVEMVNSQKKKKEIPKIPLPKTLTGKFTDIKSNTLKISPASEKRLKILSKNESLTSLPESKISTTNKVSTSISVLGSNHEIGSRLANHTLGAKLNRPIHCKPPKSKSSSSSFSSSQEGKQLPEEEIIFGVNTKNFDNVIPKCCPKKSGMFLLKETKINEKDSTEFDENEIINMENCATTLCSKENTRKIEIPLVGTFNETVLPTQGNTQYSMNHSFKCHEGEDLFSIEEDKYSALRELELYDTQVEKPSTSQVEGLNDDFGDFLSADIPITNNTVEINFFEPLKNSSNLSLEKKSEVSWEVWDCNKDLEKKTDFDDSLSTLNELIPIEPDVKNEQVFTKIEKGDDSFDLLCLEDQVSKEVSEEVSSTCSNAQKTTPDNEDSLFNCSFTNSEEKPLGLTLNTEIFCESNESEKSVINDNNNSSLKNDVSQSGNEIWDLFAQSTTPSTSNLTRQDSLPSLDFKITLGEELEQEEIWKKCLETCQAIIQEGVDILGAIDKKEIMREVFAIPKTKEYLNGLKVAYDITRRISQNYTTFPPAQEDLDKLWKKVEKLSLEHSVQIKEDLDLMSTGTNHCKICLAYTGADCVYRGDNTYHPSCANLWINCIDGKLPFAT